MKEFKKGQKAYSIRMGEVTVKKKGGEIYSIFDGCCYYLECGRCFLGDKHPSLFHSLKDMQEYFANIKETKTVDIEFWLNVYPDGHHVVCNNKLEADRHAADTRLDCIHIKRSYEVGV